MLRILAGRARCAETALLREAGAALGRGTGAVYVVVPKQLTLQTELLLIRALEPAGSFRLNVLSPERLCARIFETAGRASFERVDDRGRVMLARRAVRACEGELKAYGRAGRRRGFAARVARQLEVFRQSGLGPEDVFALADEEEGLLSAKLADMARILAAYEDALAGKYADGEAELTDAADRAARARIVDGDGVIFYGFDVMPRPLHALVASLAAACETAILFLAESDPEAPDADVFRPVNRSIARLMHEARLRGAETAREALSPGEAAVPPAIAHLELSLFAARPEGFNGAPEGVRLTALKDPQAEALYVAARCRELAMAGARWNELLIVCPDLGAYQAPLEDAFEAFGIPIFLSESRPASRHALAEALLSALALIAKGFRTEDALALLRTNCAGVAGRDADLLANYMVKYAPRGRALSQPFARGGEEAQAVEPTREKLIAPVAALRARLREAKGLRAQLAALFGYLTDIAAFEESERRLNALMEAGLYRLAGEESQVWNRIVGCLDQAAALMGEKRLAVAELSELLRESLDAAMIKPLPQSGDAVYAQTLDAAVSRSAGAVFLIGMSDRTYAGVDGLLSDYQLRRLTRASGRYLGPDGEERSLMRRYVVKSALGAAQSLAEFTYPLSASDGAAQRPSSLIGELKRILPALSEGGGARADALDEKLLSAPGAALRFLGARLSSGAGVRALATLLEKRGDSVARLLTAFDPRAASAQLKPDTASRLYGALSHASVTRLEAFGRCPFQHLMRYALAPEKVEPFVLNARDEGGFFHDAVRGFLEEVRFGLPELGIQDADRVMDEVSDILLSRMAAGEKFDTAVSRAEARRLKATARAAAEALVHQLAGSQFSPVELEVEFGRGDAAALRLSTQDGPCAVEGRIDRVDEWDAPSEGFLRVIDYKRGNTELRLCEAYYGLQLQLVTYLAAAMRRRGKSAAGVYYFKIDEGIVVDQSVDPAELEKKRRAAMKLSGLSTSDPAVLSAMSPAPEDVIAIRINKDGSISRASAAADAEGMRLIIAKALQNAANHVDGIRMGVAAASPARTRRLDPCRFCDYRRGCLFDDTLDARRVRRVEELTNEQVMDRLREEEERG